MLYRLVPPILTELKFSPDCLFGQKYGLLSRGEKIQYSRKAPQIKGLVSTLLRKLNFLLYRLFLIPGGYSQKNWAGVCCPLLKTLTLFMTKICDIPYSVYDLTINSKPYL